MTHTPGEVFLDVRVGCLAIYPAYRIGETPGCHADDDRNIHYSNKGACRDEREVWHLPQQTVDDARRIAALWNMAERLGLTTEAIEKGVIQDSYHALADHLVEEIVSGKIQRLEAENAEMLAILEELRESSTCCGTYDLLEETTWASPDLADRIESAIQKARGEE